MLVRKVIIGSALALTVSTASAAQSDSANAILPDCRSLIDIREGRERINSLNAYGAGYCAGMLNVVGYTINPEQCIDLPDHATVGQMARVIIRYIEARPQEMHRPFLVLVWEALRDAWPNKSAPSCSNRNDAGHPSGNAAPTREQVYVNMKLFGPFSRQLANLRKELK